MAIPEVRIVAVRKTGNDYEHITHLIDDSRQEWPVAEVIDRIDKKALSFYTDVVKRAEIGVNGSGSRRWVQTYADGVWSNNLLALPNRSGAA
jgi:hypothetical protein